MKPKYFKRFLSALATITISMFAMPSEASCQISNIYDTPPNASILLLAPEDIKSDDVTVSCNIHAIDGQYFDSKARPRKEVRITPGWHRIKIHFTAEVDGFSSKAEVVKVNLRSNADPGVIKLPYLDFNFEEGKSYKLSFDVEVKKAGAMTKIGGFLDKLGNITSGYGPGTRQKELPVTHKVSIDNIKIIED